MTDLLASVAPGYTYSPIAFHDSWLTVEPIVGCQLDCGYCYMQLTGWTRSRPQVVHPIADIVETLVSHKYFIPDVTVLGFGSQTDPFLAPNAPVTLEFLQRLDERGLRNAVALVTKKRIPEQVLARVSQLRHVRPVFCLSLSGLPPTIEKGVRAEENHQNLKSLAGRGHRVIHFWRPLVEANGTSEIVERILDIVSPYSLASVYIGLKLNPDLYHVYKKHQSLRIPEHLAFHYGDYIPTGVEERLRDVAARRHPEYPLYKHTSCAVSLALGTPDYNATLYREPICGGSECPAWKRQICNGARARPESAQVATLLERIGLRCNFSIGDNAIEIDGSVGQEDFAFLLHHLNYPIRASAVAFHRVVRGSIFQRH